jgi:hypothetical protein
MTSPISATEILQGVQILKKIIDSFVDPFGNAPEQIRLLVSTSQDLHDVLTESEELLRSCNRAYPGQKNFLRRLEETDAFIKKYSALADPANDGTVPLSKTKSKTARPIKIIKTIMHTFEEDKAKKIHDGLQFEMQKLIQFLLLLGL